MRIDHPFFYIMFIILALLPVVAAQATDFQFGKDIEVKFTGTITAGTTLRTESPNPAVLGETAAQQVGRSGQLAGNTGTNDLNFKSGQPVSTVLKGNLNLEIKWQELGLFAKSRAWYDFTLEHGNRPYGNSVNGFQPNIPLSDNGFAPEAKFSNILLDDLYLFGRFDVNDSSKLNLRLGRQVVRWGGAQWIGGGVDAINPIDYPARQRPGVLPEEGRVPLGMLYANLKSGQQWEVDGVFPYEFRPNVLPGCGTFFALVNYAPAGCNYASVLGNLSDVNALATGMYPKRSPDEEVSNFGQYGLSLRYSPTGWRTGFRAYLMNYHSRNPSVKAFNPDVSAGFGTVVSRLAGPNGLRYAMVYPENIQLYGASFETNLDASMRIFGEISYRPNQPLSLNASDLIAAFVGRSPTSALNLAKGTNGIPLGGSLDGYDRYPVTTTSLGINKGIPATWGAERVLLGGEIGWSHIAGLPDPGVLRYGRSDAYGIAAINGQPCSDNSLAQKSCTHDGFITSDAWGYRLHLSASYPDAFLAARLTPSLMFTHDIKGYSHDGIFLQNRTSLRPGLRADWNKKYFAEVQYTHMAGGAYNVLVDRDNVTLVVGVNF
ncbi:MAG: DUF1302 domain-containing protein [Magnetococcales bacterium]|nr:DUF1302 domain-containing protein [Magnetococcales bacterium]NGZ28535.1 DUF1302 domain-containing protein [Magnetococcales bacterium]